MNWNDIKNIIKEELKEATTVTADNSKFNLRTGVNKNPTKLGVKIQFEPKGDTLSPEAKSKVEVALQEKLNDALKEHNIQVSKDTDVPRPEVIGFFIPLSQLKNLIIKALTGKSIESGIQAPEPEGDEELKEFRRTGRQYKAQGQGGSAGNRRPGIMRGPDRADRDDKEPTDPYADKGDFYDYSAYGFSIRFLGYEDGDEVIIRGKSFNSGKVKNGKVTFKSYPMKDAQGNRLGDLGTPNSTYKLSDNYNESDIEDVLGNDHPFVLLTKSNHWKNNHSIDIDDNSISITLDTPNNLPGSLAPLSESKSLNEMKVRDLNEASKIVNKDDFYAFINAGNNIIRDMEDAGKSKSEAKKYLAYLTKHNIM